MGIPFRLGWDKLRKLLSSDLAWTGSQTFSGGIATDTISEKTAAAGVTIDGVKLKDGGATVITGGTNTFNVTNGTAILDVAAGSTVNVDASLAVTGASTINQNVSTTGSPTFAAPIATTAIADNTSTTQLATTAFAKSEDAEIANPKSFSQGVNMTAAASGSSGITVADNDNIDFGTGDFTLVWKGSLPDWTTASGVFPVFFDKYQDADNRVIFFINNVTGELFYRQTKSAVTIDKASGAGTGLTNKTAAEIVASITRESASVAGSVAFYINGVLFEALTLTAGTPADLSNTGPLATMVDQTNGQATEGVVNSLIVYNRALTAAEVLDLYRNGISFADKWGSQTSLNLATIENNGSAPYSTFSGASATGFHAESDGTGADVASTTDAISYVSGERYRVSFTAADMTGAAPIWACGDDTSATNRISGFGDNRTVTSGLNSYEFLCGETITGTVVWATAPAAVAVYTISGFSICKVGATLALEPEGIQPNPGQSHDSSSNKLHALQPVAGSSLTRRMKTFEIRGVNTWAGTHEAQSMTQLTDASRAILPTGCYIDEIIGVVAGVTIEDIIIGDGSDTDRWVTITTGLAAGTVAFTIANKISDGTNYEMVIDPDANFTGSITWTVRGHILD